MKTSTVLSPVLLAVLAATSPAAPAIGLRDAVAETLGSSPDVRVRLHQYLGARAEQGLARAGFLPTVDISHASGRELAPRQWQETASPAPSPLARWGWSASLTQNLFNGFQTIYQVRQQDHAGKAQYFQFVDTSEQQALEAARAYLDVLRQRRLLAVAQENFDSHQKIYQKIRQKVLPESGIGVGAGVDLEQAGGRLALAESNLLTVKANLADVAARYTRVVGRAPDAELAPPEAIGWNVPADDAARQVLLKDSPANRAAREAVRAARQAVNARRGAFMPTVDLRARHDWGSGVAGVRRGSYDRKQFEVVATLNLSRGGADKARLGMAAEGLNGALAERDKSCRTTRQLLEMASNDYFKLRRKIGFLREHAQASEKVRDAYLDQFEISRRSLLDVLDSENELFQSQSALIDGETDLQLAQLRSAAAAGRLLPALGLKTTEDLQLEESGDDVAVTCHG